MRAAAVAVRDRTPAALTELLRVVADRPTTPLALRLVVVAASAVGDRATALDATSRYLATVQADDPELRLLTAPGQAVAGDIAAAVASAECAVAGRPTDRGAPVREIAHELPDDAALRFLAATPNPRTCSSSR